MVKRFKHPAAVFGVSWSCHNKDMLATACEDKQVRVFYMVGQAETPLKTFSGHTAKVFRVLWSTLREGVLASASDDGTVRLWDYSGCTAGLGRTGGVLKGHTGPVRGLLWHCELAHLLISGSWDYTLRFWDIRDGACVQVVRDHGADVYGLSCSPRRPFLLASCSRDSTVRLWSMKGLNEPSAELEAVVASSPSAAATAVENFLNGGIGSKEALSVWQQRKQDQLNATHPLAELLQASPHFARAWQLLQVSLGLPDTQLSQDYSQSQVHSRHLLKFVNERARRAEVTRAGGSSHRETLLQQAASLHLRCGNLQQFVELQLRLGQWERALAVAPGVSLDYWRNLSQRYARHLAEHVHSERCIEHFLASGQTELLLKYFATQGRLLETVEVSQAAAEGLMVSPPQRSGQKQTNEDSSWNVEQIACQRITAYQRLAERHLCRGSPMQAACVLLSVDDVAGALSSLLRGHELEAVLWLGNAALGNAIKSAVQNQTRVRQIVDCAVELLALRLESHFASGGSTDGREQALRLLNRHPRRADLQMRLLARAAGPSEQLDVLYGLAGLPVRAKCAELADQITDGEEAALRWRLLSPEPELALEPGLTRLTHSMCEQGWSVASHPEDTALLWALASIQPCRLVQKCSHSARYLLYLLCAYQGALLALRRGYIAVVAPLLATARRLLDMAEQAGPVGRRGGGLSLRPFSAKLLDAEMGAWQAHCKEGSPSKGTVWKELLRKAGLQDLQRASGQETLAIDEWEAVDWGEDFPSGCHLPSHSDVQVSLMNGERIRVSCLLFNRIF